MFDVAPTELIVFGTVALLVIPPKDLPRAMRTAGYWIGKARGMARQFRSGFDSMVREAELQEMEKRWAAENDRIMREHSVENMMLPKVVPPARRATDPDEAAVDRHDQPASADPSAAPDPVSETSTPEPERSQP